MNGYDTYNRIRTEAQETNWTHPNASPEEPPECFNLKNLDEGEVSIDELWSNFGIEPAPPCF